MAKYILSDALFCITDVVSALRNESQVRATAIREEIIKDCLFSLDTALDPGQFFDWCLSPERQYTPVKDGATKKYYWEAIGRLYKEIPQSAVLTKQVGQREKLLGA